MTLLVSGTEQNNWDLTQVTPGEQLEINVTATSYTLTADILFKIEVQLGNAANLLNAGGGILVVTVKITPIDTGDKCILQQKQMNLIAGDQLALISLDPIWAESGSIIEVYAKSSNTNDISVGGKTWIADITPTGGGDATEAKQDTIIAATSAIQTETDKLDNMIIVQSAGNEFTIKALENAPSGTGSTPAAFVAALLAETGWTAGGIMTIETLYKLMSAWIGGNWRDKSGSSTIKELLDADDGSTVIAEMTVSQTTPQKDDNNLMSITVVGAGLTPAITGGVFMHKAVGTADTPLGVSPAEILADYIITVLASLTLPSVGSTWPLWTNHMPDGRDVEDNCVSIYDTTGIKDGRIMSGTTLEHFGLQLRLRALDNQAGYTKLEAIMASLDAVVSKVHTIGSDDYILQNISRTSPVISLGLEEGTRRRFLFTVNFLAQIRKV